MLTVGTIAAFLAACVFLGIAAFGATLGDVPLVPAGLFSLAIGFTLYMLGKLLYAPPLPPRPR